MIIAWWVAKKCAPSRPSSEGPTGTRVENQQKQIRLLKHQVANLSEFVIRLTKVYDGAFPDIDAPLQQLRAQLQSPSQVLQIESTISELTGPVLKNSEAIRGFNHQVVNQLESIVSLLLNDEESTVELKQKANFFISELNTSQQSLNSLSNFLESGLALMKEALSNGQRGTRSSLQEDMLATSKLHEKITEEFRALVAQLIASEPEDEALGEIAQQLDSGISRQDLMQCCLVVLRTLIDEVLQERKHAEKYVIDLQKTLIKVGQHVKDSISSSEKAYQVKLDNSRALKAQIDHFGNEVNNAIDLAILKQQACETLDKMASTLADREQFDKDEQVSLMELLSGMKSKLASLERETETYKQRLLEQKYHSYRDSLTQVPNRNAYNERVELEFRRWKRHKQPLSLAVVDVDHFKKINDNFGHAAGDKTLQVIAQSISKCLRATDFFARWGGEEFVVLLPQTSLEHVRKPLEAIRKQIQRIPFKFKDKSVSITASVGATEFIPGDTIATVFERADQALYEAKNAGRNRCIIIEG